MSYLRYMWRTKPYNGHVETIMAHNLDFATAPSQAIMALLGRRIDDIRLSRNISQDALAKSAGVSRRTVTRLTDGQAVSLDTFVRIMQALKLTDHLAALLPDPSVRPVDRVRLSGEERQRARASSKTAAAPWRWGDEKQTK
jgi:putative transcriptional regulator